MCKESYNEDPEVQNTFAKNMVSTKNPNETWIQFMTVQFDSLSEPLKIP